MDVWIAYPYLLYFSDQFSCIKFFNPSYGLKDIEFQSLNHFKRFFGFLLLLNITLSRIGHLTSQTYMWDPTVIDCVQ